jgi:hypothetical protein
MRALPLVLLSVAVSGDAFAQQFVCDTIREGDTAAHLALRLTNSVHNRHEPWFQILEPATSRFIAKAGYDAILPGWKVCIAREAAADRPMLENTGGSRPAITPPHDRLVAAKLAYVSMVAVAVLAPLLAWPVAKKHFDRRRAMLERMSAFAAVFVGEFARPLPRQHAADQPIKARLQCAPYRARLDIFLAPNNGHRYPNLSDHKKNLEYDVERISRLVAHQPFVRGEPYSRGEWVVIPFQVKAGMIQEGAR